MLPRSIAALALATLALSGAIGCTTTPSLVAVADQRAIDRSVVEYPPNMELRPLVRGLTAPVAMAVVDAGPHKGALLVVEGGIEDVDVRITAFDRDGSATQVYPTPSKIPLPFLSSIGRGFAIRGPIGGMLVSGGKIFISHRDANDDGAISTIGLDGSHATIAANLPARGEFGVTDLAIRPTDGRLFFGVGAATNSGVVGIDDYEIGWLGHHRDFSDLPYSAGRDGGGIKVNGDRFRSANPYAGLLGGDEVAVTAALAPFDRSIPSRLRKGVDRPTSAIYSVNPSGGDMRVEAWGIRLPRGMAFDDYGTLFFTNDGMELRGSRPVKNDPDTLMKLTPGFWYGFPDFSTDLYPLSMARFQPLDIAAELMLRSGYNELAFLIDHDASGVTSPAPFRDSVLRATFTPLSGAGKLAFVPSNFGSAFKDLRGLAIVTLSGDRAPFATSERKLETTPGRMVMRIDVDPDRRQVRDFIHNTKGQPASELGQNVEALERPIDVKFGLPGDDRMFLLDFGQMKVQRGKEKITAGTGKVFVLVPAGAPATKPADQARVD